MNIFFQAVLCVGMTGALLLLLHQSVAGFHWRTEMEDPVYALAFRRMPAVIGCVLILWAVLAAPCVGA